MMKSLAPSLSLMRQWGTGRCSAGGGPLLHTLTLNLGEDVEGTGVLAAQTDPPSEENTGSFRSRFTLRKGSVADCFLAPGNPKSVEKWAEHIPLLTVHPIQQFVMHPWGGGVRSSLNEYAGWYFQGDICFHLLRRPNSGELREGVGGTFSRPTPRNTAPSQEPLDCTHSTAHHFKREQK